MEVCVKWGFSYSVSDPANALVWCSAETGSDHLHVIAEEAPPRGTALHWAGHGHDEHGHGIHGDGSRQRELTAFRSGTKMSVSAFTRWVSE